MPIMLPCGHKFQINAFKYGLQETNSQLRISLSKASGGEYKLTVADTGKGLPDGFNVEKAKSLVRRLVKQLQGSVSYAYQAGAVFTVTFKDTSARPLVD